MYFLFYFNCLMIQIQAKNLPESFKSTNIGLKPAHTDTNLTISFTVNSALTHMFTRITISVIETVTIMRNGRKNRCIM